MRRLAFLASLCLFGAGLASAQAPVRLGPTSIILETPITFTAGTADLDASARPVLDAVVRILLSNPSVTLEIGAHTDDRGAEAFNQRTSQQRADAIRDYLVAHGVPARRLRAMGYGETVPLDTNRTEAGRAANRRIELRRTDVP